MGREDPDPDTTAMVFEYVTDPEGTGSERFSGATSVHYSTTSGHVYVSDIANGLFVFRDCAP